MKILIHMTLAVALLGCGQEGKSAVDISKTNIVWQGYPSQPNKPPMITFEMEAAFNSTISCLKSLDINATGQPYVIVTDGWFYCGDALNIGCYDTASKTVYIGNYGYEGVFKHEVIHWATGIETDAHESPLFSCETL